MKRIICTFVALIAIAARAEIKLPQFFADGMVLQQQTECKLWGTATKDATVSITTSWDSQTYQTKAATDGSFEVKLHTPKAGGPFTITLKEEYLQISNLRSALPLGSSKKSQTSNLSLTCFIGEVWLCSGQSNMEMPMKGYKGQPVEGSTEELLQCRDSLLHFFTVQRTASLTPLKDVTGTWQSATMSTVRDCSATAYYFGHALRRTLGVPVGLIITSWGGSACEAWMKADWLKAFPQVQQTITETDVKKLQQRCPTALYNGQLAPLVGYGIRGAIWYQGEDNIPRYEYYAELLKTMVEGWRTDWQLAFPFYFCQIAPFDYSDIDWAKYNSALLREQQQKAETIIDNARMAVLMDTGLSYCIHPRKKRQAGERLAFLALSNTYGEKGLPEFAKYGSVEFKGDTAVVAFDRSKEWVYFENGTHSTNFEISGADKIFHPAKAWVNRNRVYVTSDEVKQPVAVRYAFHDWVVGDLMHDGLPVSSFRTDEW